MCLEFLNKDVIYIQFKVVVESIPCHWKQGIVRQAGKLSQNVQIDHYLTAS